MTLVVDINHWLDEGGGLPTANLRLRRNALRIATLIEYGANLEPGEGRETLAACRRRPARAQCLGMLWVVKLPDNRIEAYCNVCRDTEAVISGWEDTIWADGMMPAIPMKPDPDPGPGDSGGNGTQRRR